MHWLSRINIRFRSRFVGEDNFGNRYYESNARRSDSRPRRYVIYKGKVEASKVPSDWHDWLHYTEFTAPPDGGYMRSPWQRTHLPNLTGTQHAYRPAGHLLGQGRRRRATGDYHAWDPEFGDHEAAKFEAAEAEERSPEAELPEARPPEEREF